MIRYVENPQLAPPQKKTTLGEMKVQISHLCGQTYQQIKPTIKYHRYADNNVEV